MTWLLVVLAALSVMACAVAIGALVRARRLRARLDEAERQLLARTSEPALISHEIRTPLALIRGAAELLEDERPGPLTPRQRQFVHTITENSALINGIAENFLTGLRVTNGEIERAEVDIRAVVAGTATEIRHITDVPVHVDAVGGLLRVQADARLVRQLVWNLVNNAVRHSEPDSPVVVRVDDAPDGGVHIVVTDTGTGMLEEDLENLFTPFYTGSSRRAGTGIGMMVSRQIVLAHGGTIAVDSTADVGTAVHVVLPRGDAAADREGEPR